MVWETIMMLIPLSTTINGRDDSNLAVHSDAPCGA